MSMTLSSHNGKSIIYDPEENQRVNESGRTRQRVKLSEEAKDAIKVFIDKDGCICDAG